MLCLCRWPSCCTSLHSMAQPIYKVPSIWKQELEHIRCSLSMALWRLPIYSSPCWSSGELLRWWQLVQRSAWITQLLLQPTDTSAASGPFLWRSLRTCRLWRPSSTRASTRWFPVDWLWVWAALLCGVPSARIWRYSRKLSAGSVRAGSSRRMWSCVSFPSFSSSIRPRKCGAIWFRHQVSEVKLPTHKKLLRQELCCS